MEMEFKDTSRRRSLLLVIGVLLAIGAGGAAFYLASQGGTDTSPIATRNVVVAAVDIPPRTPITAEQLTQRTVPDDPTLANAISDPGLVINRTTAVSIYQFQPITPNLLATTSAGTTWAVLSPTETISPFSPVWRAASLEIPKQRALGGEILPGQRVDILATMEVTIFVQKEDGTWAQQPTEDGIYTEKTTKLLWSDVELLARNPEEDIYIFKFDLHQSEELAHLTSAGSPAFSLVLRPEGDIREIDRSGYGETTNRILEQYNFPLPETIDTEAYPQPSTFPTPFPAEPYLSPPPSPAPSPSAPAEGTAVQPAPTPQP